MSRGPHLLIKQGAKLVEGPQDILEELLPQLEEPYRDRLSRHSGLSSSPSPLLGPEEEALYNCVPLEPSSLEDVISQSSLAPAAVMSILLTLELKGVIRQLPGAQYVRTSINTER